MNGDRSRNTFDPTRHFSAVRLQQGRVITDADWNEQADLTRHRAELQALDMIGGSGAPAGNAGYALLPATYALAVQVVDDKAVWVAAEDGMLLRKKKNIDGEWGQWEISVSGTTAHLRSLHMVEDTGWAAGDAGTLLKLRGGDKWAAQTSGTWRTLRGITSVDAEHAWAVGDGGVVLRTSDGGVNWALVQTEATCLQAVHFSDAKSGLVVGNDGVILATSDGGASWSRRDSGTEVHLYAVCFHESAGWAAGDKGTILATQDGGKTWKVIHEAEPKAAPLRAVTCWNTDFILAAGDRGLLLYSNDGGTDWKEIESERRATLRALSNPVNDVVWAVGDALTATQDDLQGGTPERSAALLINAGQGVVVGVDKLPDTRLSILPGRYYVEGKLCELETRVTYYQQAGSLVEPLQHDRAYLMYLNAWERHISCIEAPSIREVALGGPDTATRSQTIGQVRALSLEHELGEEPSWSCNDEIPEWSAQSPRMAARATPQPLASNLCGIAKAAGYRRLENQLYRVEIHDGGSKPSYKWSRENGSIAYPVLSMTSDAGNMQNVVRLAARGRDSNLDLAVGDCVELVDDDAALMLRVGTLFRYVKDGDDEREIVLDGVVTHALGRNPARHPLLRRWDHKPDETVKNALPLKEGEWIELEEGIEIRFEPGGHYRPGDFWEIPARTITSDIEWPQSEEGVPLSMPPAGGEDRHAKLGLVKISADGLVSVMSDCRVLFPKPSNTCCHMVVGRGGQVEKLNKNTIRDLFGMGDGRRQLCLCLLPGEHKVDDLKLKCGADGFRDELVLSIHGCGRASELIMRDSVAFTGFVSIELSDVTIRFEGGGGQVNFFENHEVRLSNVDVVGAVSVSEAERVSIVDCFIGSRGEDTSALFSCGNRQDGIWHVARNFFRGGVSFYDGDPVEFDEQLVMVFFRKLANGLRGRALAWGSSAKIFFTENSLARLVIGQNSLTSIVNFAEAEAEAGAEVRGLFEVAVISGNTISQQPNLFVSRLLAFSGNGLESDGDGMLCGALIADRVTVIGNVASGHEEKNLVVVANKVEHAANLVVVLSL